jgi:mRNA (2'-O-methyladenosine-N6-)-methyltransferase
MEEDELPLIKSKSKTRKKKDVKTEGDDEDS